MKLIVDANIVISSILKDGRTRKLLLNDALILYAPLFLKEEVMKYKSDFAEKTGTTEYEIAQFAEELFKLASIEFVDTSMLTTYIEIAKRISPDPKDTLYIALAIFEGCSIWSNDRLLREGQNLVQVMTTNQLYDATQAI